MMMKMRNDEKLSPDLFIETKQVKIDDKTNQIMFRINDSHVWGCASLLCYFSKNDKLKETKERNDIGRTL